MDARGICHIGKHKSTPEFLTKLSVFDIRLVMKYDPLDRVIYWLRDSQLQKITLDTKDQSPLNASFPSGFAEFGKYVSMSLDWITKNLFFVHDKYVHVIDLKNISKGSKKLFTPYHNGAVEVFPDEGYLVYAYAGMYAQQKDPNSNRIHL